MTGSPTDNSMAGRPSVLAEITRLYSADYETRCRAIDNLVLVGEPAVRHLMDVITAADGWVMQERLRSVETSSVDPKKRADLARQAAATALNRIGAPALPALKAALTHSKPEVTIAAIAALRGVDDQTVVETLRTLLSDEVRAIRRRRRIWIARYAAGVAAGFIVSVTASAYVSVPNWLSPVLLFAFAGGAFVDAKARLRHTVISVCSESSDPRFVGPLALCLAEPDRGIRSEVAVALRTLLPRVKASDRKHIQPDEMSALLKCLRGRDEAMVMATLTALEQIGDERAIADVEGLTRHRTARIRFAAHECLTYLRQRLETDRQARTLLRASEPTSDAPGTLLRAARADNGTPVDELLRVAEPAASEIETANETYVQVKHGG